MDEDVLKFEEGDTVEATTNGNEYQALDSTRVLFASDPTRLYDYACGARGTIIGLTYRGGLIIQFENGDMKHGCSKHNFKVVDKKVYDSKACSWAKKDVRKQL